MHHPPSSANLSHQHSTVFRYSPRLFLDWANHFHHLAALLCHLLTIGLMSSLLYFVHKWPYRFRTQRISRSLRLYMLVHIVLSATGVPHLAYRTYGLLLDGLSFHYSPATLYWTGIFELNYMTVACVPVLFLTLDRSVTLKMGGSLNYETVRNFIYAASILTICTMYSLSLSLYLLEMPLQRDKLRECRVSSCLMLNHRHLPQLFIRAVFSSANLASSLYFFRLLKQHQIRHRVNDSIVRFTIIFELLFNSLPSFFAFTFHKCTGVMSTHLLGEHVILFFSLDAACCSIVYWTLFWRRDIKELRLKKRRSLGLTSTPREERREIGVLL